jgi:hypothetical protein
MSTSYGLFHYDFHAHPGMDAAHKKMFTFRQTGDLGVAALKDAGPGHRDVLKAVGTFGDRGLSCIKIPYKAATEMHDLGEGMGLAALVDYVKNGSLLHVDGVRLEVPARVRFSSGYVFK